MENYSSSPLDPKAQVAANLENSAKLKAGIKSVGDAISPNPNLEALGKELFPEGFSDAEMGSLDKAAAMKGMVAYADGHAFDREALINEIAEKLAELNDLHLLQIKSKVLAMNDDISIPKKSDMESPDNKVSDTGADKVVDTNVLTGPLNGLKSFLVQQQRDNDAKD